MKEKRKKDSCYDSNTIQILKRPNVRIFFFFKGLTLGYLKKQKKKRKTHVKKNKK